MGDLESLYGIHCVKWTLGINHVLKKIVWAKRMTKMLRSKAFFSDPIWKCFLLLQQNLKMQTFFFVIPSCKRKKKKRLFKQMRITKMLRSKAFFLIRSKSVFFYYSKTWNCKWFFFVIQSFAIVKERQTKNKKDDKNAQIQSLFSDPIWKCFLLLQQNLKMQNFFLSFKVLL